MRKIRDMIPAHLYTAGEVGIEVEMEGAALYHGNTDLWKHERDDSLRGRDTAEYVLKSPILLTEVEDALGELTEALEDSVLSPSVRCGVHVHVNVQDMTLTQVATFTTLYLVLEDLLLEVCGEGRQSNLFCLKGCEAELLMESAASFFRTGDMGYIDNDEIRYSGINLAALAKFGSVEFRALRTPDNLLDIMPWVDTLGRLAKFSKERYANPIEVISAYSGFDPEGFVWEMAPLYATQLMAIPNWKERIRNGMRSAQDLAFSQRWPTEVVRSEPATTIEPAEVDDMSDVPEAIRDMIASYPSLNPQDIIAAYRARGE